MGAANSIVGSWTNNHVTCNSSRWPKIYVSRAAYIDLWRWQWLRNEYWNSKYKINSTHSTQVHVHDGRILYLPLPSSSAFEIRPRRPVGWSVISILKISLTPVSTDSCLRICPVFPWKHSTMMQTLLLQGDDKLNYHFAFDFMEKQTIWCHCCHLRQLLTLSVFICRGV